MSTLMAEKVAFGAKKQNVYRASEVAELLGDIFSRTYTFNLLRNKVIPSRHMPSSGKLRQGQRYCTHDDLARFLLENPVLFQEPLRQIGVEPPGDAAKKRKT